MHLKDAIDGCVGQSDSGDDASGYYSGDEDDGGVIIMHPSDSEGVDSDNIEGEAFDIEGAAGGVPATQSDE